ncbi:MAG TPA: hypothetical protein VJ024_03495 [Thermodesulfovibrionales bacterium]|nr:hypothetical protein [Thermodesulfovibrionales bacterium]
MKVPDRRCVASRILTVLNSEKGMALVLTLMILILITAMVVEFSYGVYTATSALYNWKDSQRLSFVSKSGITMAVKTISDIPQAELYKYLEKKIPVENMSERFKGTLIIIAEDENSKINLNSLRNPDSIKVFKRLLRNLVLNEDIADRVADWIDTDSEPRLRDSEEGAKNAYLDSVDELLLIKGIDHQTYEKLLSHVTVYGYTGVDDTRINMNTTSIPVIMSLDDMITRELAEGIVNYRKLNPFRLPADLEKAGCDTSLRSSISQRFTVDPPKNFRITSASEENRIKRVIECVVTIDGTGRGTIKYWREM